MANKDLKIVREVDANTFEEFTISPLANKFLAFNATGDPVVKDAGGTPVNIETLVADKTLTASDAPIQIYTFSNFYYVHLPMTGLTAGQRFEIYNINAYSSQDYVLLKADGVVIDYLSSQKSITCIWDGSAWQLNRYKNTSFGEKSLSSNGGIAIGSNANGGAAGIGLGSYASATSSGVAIGNSSNGGYEGVAVGGQADGRNNAVAVGRQASVNSKLTNTVAIGTYSVAQRNREIVSTATESTTNKAQMSIQKYKESLKSSNGFAWQELFIDASSARLTILNSSIYHFLIQINAIEYSTEFYAKTWEIKGIIKRPSGGSVYLEANQIIKTVTYSDSEANEWDAQVSADTTNQSLKIEIKHNSASDVRYSLNIFATETRL